ncbi:MAG: dehydrogenase [Gammaproteobacteria bacterium]|nr:dehydrogenase [Gammaproteobacteria bacterium]|tara:strand:- start:18473 stop:19216 length:744 start_codon:yes stop_codon:yes gene_type:complete
MAQEIGLVTGAASGIGAAVARQLAQGGAKVAVMDVNEQAGVEVAAEIGGEFIRCDVSDYDNFDGAIAACVERLGVPDYAHLNAGVMTVGQSEAFLPLEEVTLEQYRRIIGVNLDGVFNGLKSLLPRMRDNGGGITATASIAGLGPLPFDPLYGTTKHAVVGLVRAVAAANEGSGLRINCICPGGVDTAIIPDALKAGGFNAMTPDVMAAEVVDLLTQAPNGEVRVKLSADQPAFAVPAMELGAAPDQ